MTITASTMILSALRMIGEKSPGGTLSSAEQTDYLYDLNSFVESLGIDRANCWQLLQESKALTAGVSSYTIGTGGDFSTTRPNKIDDPCFIRDSSNNDSPLEIIDAARYGKISNKSEAQGTPGYLFYDNGYVSGLATIYLYPEPSSDLTLYINSWKQLQSFSLISTTLAMPPGYQLAIESNFAVFKAGGYTKVSPEIAKIARDSMARVRALNLPDTVMTTDPAVVGYGGRWNINNG